MLTKSEYIDAYSSNGEMYAIPWQESLKGFVYDHDEFLKYGLLFNESGTLISSPTETLSKGKDGVAGTFDDGHPVTEEQWETMVIAADQIFGNAFTYTGKFAIYLNDLFYTVMAQYDGVDQYKIHYTFNGEYDLDGDGVKETTITPQSFIGLADAPGKVKAVRFMDKYVACKDASLGVAAPYVNKKAGTNSYSHTDAQDDFILGIARNRSEKNAMLYEGDWWENESQGTFEALVEEENNTAYTFKTRNYKFMTLPTFAGQKEAQDTNVFPIGESYYVALKKQTDSTKSQICKDFLTYMFAPSNIQNYAVTCGGIMPYDVELTAAQEAALSPFAKNLREIYYSPKTKTINHNVLLNSNDTAKGGMPNIIGGNDTYIIVSALYYTNGDDYIATQKSSWAAAGERTFYERYQAYLAAKGGKN